MEIKEMNLSDIEARKAEIEPMIDTAEGEALEAISKELDELNTRAAEIRAEIEQRNAAKAKVIEGRDIEKVEKIEKETEETMDNKEIRNSAAYCKAYFKFAMTGNDKEARALLTENVAGEALPVPEFVEEAIRTAWDNNDILSGVKKTYYRGNLKVGFEVSATGAWKHTEGSAAQAAETLVIGHRTLIPAYLKKWILVSDEAFALSDEAFRDYVYREVAQKITKLASDLLIADIKTAATTATTTMPGVPSVKAATIATTTIATAIGALSDEASKPVVIINKASLAAFKAVQYGAGVAFDPFEGLEVRFSDQVAAYSAASTNDVYAIVGDLNGAHANFPEGENIRFITDEATYAEQDLVKIVGKEFIGLGIVADKHFVTIKK